MHQLVAGCSDCDDDDDADKVHVQFNMHYMRMCVCKYVCIYESVHIRILRTPARLPDALVNIGKPNM